MNKYHFIVLMYILSLLFIEYSVYSYDKENEDKNFYTSVELPEILVTQELEMVFKNNTSEFFQLSVFKSKERRETCFLNISALQEMGIKEVKIWSPSFQN